MLCYRCGSPLQFGDRFCPRCGARTAEGQYQDTVGRAPVEPERNPHPRQPAGNSRWPLALRVLALVVALSVAGYVLRSTANRDASTASSSNRTRPVQTSAATVTATATVSAKPLDFATLYPR